MGPAATDYAIMVLVVIVFFVITFFLSYHLAKSDALLISTYTEEALTSGEMRKAPKLIAITYNEDMDYRYENWSFCQMLCQKQEIEGEDANRQK